MANGFKVLSTPNFDREIKKEFKKDKEILGILDKIAAILARDPFNQERKHDIKKLTDIKEGEGPWRIRVKNYRFRYDIIKKDVILHSAKNRRDAYRQ